MISTKTLFFILVFVAALFEAIGDAVLKQWAIKSGKLLFGVGFGVYLLAIIVWAVTLKYEYLSKAISIVTILNLIIVILIGIFLFKEKLTLINTIGLGLGVVSVVLMSIE